MARYISQRLSNLFREHSYVKGRMVQAQRKLARLKREIEQSEEVCRASQIEIDRLAGEIKILAPEIELDQVKATKKMKPRRFRHGALNELLIRLLREASGELSTSQLMVMTAQELGVPLIPQENYNRHREAIRRQLAHWAVKGFVERLHSPTEKGNYIEGLWRWRRYGPA